MDQLQYQKKIIREEYGDLKKPAEEETVKKESLISRPKRSNNQFLFRKGGRV